MAPERLTDEQISDGADMLWLTLDLNGHTPEGVKRAAARCYLAMSRLTRPDEGSITLNNASVQRLLDYGLLRHTDEGWVVARADRPDEGEVERAWGEIVERLNCEFREGIITYRELKFGVNNAALMRDAALRRPIEEQEGGLSKEWCMNMAAREGDAEIGAGLLSTPSPNRPDEGEVERKSLVERLRYHQSEAHRLAQQIAGDPCQGVVFPPIAPIEEQEKPDGPQG